MRGRGRRNKNHSKHKPTKKWNFATTKTMLNTSHIPIYDTWKLSKLSFALGHKALRTQTHKMFSTAVKNQVEKEIFFLFLLPFVVDFPYFCELWICDVQWRMKRAVKHQKLHFVNGSFTIFDITIFCFQIATGWWRWFLGCCCFV